MNKIKMEIFNYCRGNVKLYVAIIKAIQNVSKQTIWEIIKLAISEKMQSGGFIK